MARRLSAGWRAEWLRMPVKARSRPATDLERIRPRPGTRPVGCPAERVFAGGSGARGATRDITTNVKRQGLEQVIFQERDRKLEEARLRRQIARQQGPPPREVAG
jgi:hypothetical protein